MDVNRSLELDCTHVFVVAVVRNDVSSCCVPIFIIYCQPEREPMIWKFCNSDCKLPVLILQELTMTLKCFMMHRGLFARESKLVIYAQSTSVVIPGRYFAREKEEKKKVYIRDNMNLYNSVL